MAGVGVRVQGARTAAEISQSVASQAEDQRTSEAGVNLDEEAARLLQFQQSYQAAAKVLQVAQSLFDTLLQTRRRAEPSMQRITTAHSFDTGVERLQKRQSELTDAQERLTSGKRVSRPATTRPPRRAPSARWPRKRAARPASARSTPAAMPWP